MRYAIRAAKLDEWEDAMSLCWLTFQKYEACDYSERGVQSFLEFISDEGLYKMFMVGEYKVYLAFDGPKIIGVISLRMINHISLLFVDEKYFRQGVGRALIEYATVILAGQYNKTYCTVNSSPYATEFYHKLGFKDMGEQTENDGIMYTPMKLTF